MKKAADTESGDDKERVKEQRKREKNGLASVIERIVRSKEFKGIKPRM